MRANTAKKITRIPRALVEIEGGLVILSLKEYQRLVANSIPAIYLKGNRAKALDRLVAEGLEEHAHGKTRTIGSLADLDR